MGNLDLYECVRQVPENAQKEISGGRLKGMTDINPMWRIQALTEQFGPCGIGWKYEISRQWMEPGATNEIAAFCDINLYIKMDGAWSEAIPGTGGSTFVSQERNGLYTSDECYKMALTDALSVACKALGMGADVYWQSARTKYADAGKAPQDPIIGRAHVDTMQAELKRIGKSEAFLLDAVNKNFGSNYRQLQEMTTKQFIWVMGRMKATPSQEASA